MGEDKTTRICLDLNLLAMGVVIGTSIAMLVNLYNGTYTWNIFIQKILTNLLILCVLGVNRLCLK